MFHLSSIFALCLLIRATFAFSGNNGWEGLSTILGVTNYDSNNQNLNFHRNFSSFGNGGNFYLNLDQRLKNNNVQHTIAQAVPISEHVEVTKPVIVPVVKNIGIPVTQPVTIPVPHPMAVGVAQPYPVHVPVVQPVAVPVVKTVAIPVEKKIPYPIEKIIPVPVEKLVPIKIEKHIPVPVEKLYPIHIPVYKHIFHRRRIKKYGRKRIY